VVCILQIQTEKGVGGSYYNIIVYYSKGVGVYSLGLVTKYKQQTKIKHKIFIVVSLFSLLPGEVPGSHQKMKTQEEFFPICGSCGQRHYKKRGEACRFNMPVGCVRLKVGGVFK
jgi:hypothetical protein